MTDEPRDSISGKTRAELYAEAGLDRMPPHAYTATEGRGYCDVCAYGYADPIHKADGMPISGDTLGVNRDGDGRPVGLWFLPDTVDPEGYVMLTPEQFAYLREQLDGSAIIGAPKNAATEQKGARLASLRNARRRTHQANLHAASLAAELSAVRAVLNDPDLVRFLDKYGDGPPYLQDGADEVIWRLVSFVQRARRALDGRVVSGGHHPYHENVERAFYQPRIEQGHRIDCAKNGCATRHSDDGRVFEWNAYYGECPREGYVVNGHATTYVERTLTPWGEP